MSMTQFNILLILSISKSEVHFPHAVKKNIEILKEEYGHIDVLNLILCLPILYGHLSKKKKAIFSQYIYIYIFF